VLQARVYSSGPVFQLTEASGQVFLHHLVDVTGTICVSISGRRLRLLLNCLISAVAAVS